MCVFHITEFPYFHITMFHNSILSFMCVLLLYFFCHRMLSLHQSLRGMHNKRVSCELHATPERSLVDEVLHIRVTGGNAEQPITLLARMEDEGKRFFSYAHYLSDSQGEIDLTKSASQGGFYTGQYGNRVLLV